MKVQTAILSRISFHLFRDIMMTR